MTGYDGRHGIRLAEGANRKIGPTHIERVAISHLGGVGLHLVGTSAGDGALVGTWILDCDVSSCALQGMLLEHAFQTYAVRSRFAANGLEGVLGHHSEVVLRACTFDGNRTTGDASEPKADLVIDQCSLARVDACKFKNFGGGSKRACYMDHLTGVAIVGASVFELDEEVAGSIGIEFASASAPRYGAIAVLPNRFANVETAALVADAVAGATVFPQASDSTSSIVVPSGTNDAPVAVAALSTVAANLPSGLLIPVLSTIPSDQDTSLNVQGGMLVYVVMTNPASESLAAYIAGGWHDVPAS